MKRSFPGEKEGGGVNASLISAFNFVLESSFALGPFEEKWAGKR